MKKKIIPVIIPTVLFLAGLVMVIAGVMMCSGRAVQNYPELDLFNISDDDIGKTFTADIYTDVIYNSDTEDGALYLLWIYSTNYEDSDMMVVGDEDEDLLMVMGFDVPKSVFKVFEQAQNTGEYSEDKPFSFSGTIRKSNDDITGKLSDGITNYYSYLKEIYGDTEGIINEDAFKESYTNISPYYIEVAETANGDVYIWTGFAVMAAALIVLLIVLFGKKFLIVFAVLFAISVVILLICLTGKLRTMASVTEVSDGLYKMTCYYDYKCDEFINADISTIDGIIEWMVNEHFSVIRLKLTRAISAVQPLLRQLLTDSVFLAGILIMKRRIL